MKYMVLVLTIAVFAIAILVTRSASAQSQSGNLTASHKKIDIYDNCDPRDQDAWAPTGGCLIDEKEGNVPFAEFNLLLVSPLSAAVVGHPSWRNEPSYVTVRSNTSVRVENEGGRGHTFTRVAQFGGGTVPQLNQGLTQAPECVMPSGLLNPGQGLDLAGLPVGVHRYQCCIHPWMRAVIKVAEK